MLVNNAKDYQDITWKIRRMPAFLCLLWSQCCDIHPCYCLNSSILMSRNLHLNYHCSPQHSQKAMTDKRYLTILAFILLHNTFVMWLVPKSLWQFIVSAVFESESFFLLITTLICIHGDFWSVNVLSEGLSKLCITIIDPVPIHTLHFHII